MFINMRAELLYDALTQHDVRMVEAWIKSEKDINAPQNNCLDRVTKEPLSPFQMAAKQLGSFYNPASKTILDLFIQAGCNINQVCNDTSTVLYRALSYDEHHMIDYLIQNGVKVDTQDQNGQTVFHKMGKWIFDDKVEVSWDKLLPLSPDFNIQDNDGNTPLHLVRNIRIANIMLKNGARANVVNIMGKYPDQTIQDSYGEENTYTIGLRRRRITQNNRELKSACSTTIPSPSKKKRI